MRMIQAQIPLFCHHIYTNGPAQVSVKKAFLQPPKRLPQQTPLKKTQQPGERSQTSQQPKTPQTTHRSNISSLLTTKPHGNTGMVQHGKRRTLQTSPQAV